MQDEQIRLQKQQLEEMRQQQKERDDSREKGVDAASVISTVGKVAVTGMALKAGHNILKGIKDSFF